MEYCLPLGRPHLFNTVSTTGILSASLADPIYSVLYKLIWKTSSHGLPVVFLDKLVFEKLMVSVATLLFNMQIYGMLSYGKFHHYDTLQVNTIFTSTHLLIELLHFISNYDKLCMSLQFAIRTRYCLTEEILTKSHPHHTLEELLAVSVFSRATTCRVWPVLSLLCMLSIMWDK